MKNLMQEQRSIVQRLVFVSRRIVEAADENNAVPPMLLGQLEALVKEADHAGIHGQAIADDDNLALEPHGSDDLAQSCDNPMFSGNKANASN